MQKYIMQGIEKFYLEFGKNLKWLDCYISIETAMKRDNFKFDKYEAYLTFERELQKYLDSKIEYGLFIGRCMPFHKGHNSILQEIIRSGKKPVVLLGGTDKSDERHPLSFEERKRIIKFLYPTVKVLGIEDKDDWTEWYRNLIDVVNIPKEQITLFEHTKEQDKRDFVFNGQQYTNESYTKIFKDEGFRIQEVQEVQCSKGEVIHASDIRNNEETAKRNLDARVYIHLKNLKGWWK